MKFISLCLILHYAVMLMIDSSKQSLCRHV